MLNDWLMNSCVNEEWAKIKQRKNWDVNFDVFKQSSKEKKCDKLKTEGSLFVPCVQENISNSIVWRIWTPKKH